MNKDYVSLLQDKVKDALLQGVDAVNLARREEHSHNYVDKTTLHTLLIMYRTSVIFNFTGTRLHWYQTSLVPGADPEKIERGS